MDLFFWNFFFNLFIMFFGILLILDQVKIHVESNTGFIRDILDHVGLDSNRLIAGHIKAKDGCFFFYLNFFFFF